MINSSFNFVEIKYISDNLLYRISQLFQKMHSERIYVYVGCYNTVENLFAYIKHKYSRSDKINDNSMYMGPFSVLELQDLSFLMEKDEEYEIEVVVFYDVVNEKLYKEINNNNQLVYSQKQLTKAKIVKSSVTWLSESGDLYFGYNPKDDFDFNKLIMTCFNK